MVDGSLFKYEPVFVFTKGKPRSAMRGKAKSLPVTARVAIAKAKSGHVVALDALTPVEKHGGIYFKRDDLFRPFSDIGISGGKIRQCLSLIKNNLREIRKYHDGTIVCAAVTKSSTGAAAICSRGRVKSSQW